MHLEPWQSWAVVGAGAVGAYFYYSRTGSKRRGGGRPTSVSNLGKRRTSPQRASSTDAGSAGSGARQKSQSKKGDNRVEVNAAEASSSALPQSSGGKLKKRKGGKKESSQLAESSAVEAAHVDGQEENIDNREFAKQMTGLKTGSSLAKTEGSKKQTRKAGKQAELPLNSFDALSPDVNGASSSKDLSNASSTTGADADDDLSPAVSPPLGAKPTATSGGVEDMLEAPSKGPSVFRLTSIEEQKRQAKPSKAVQEPETKKQRQNRKKNEEKKLAKEEAERERRVLLERQLRTAREAEGRPARNGVAVAPKTNAWSKSSAGLAAPQQASSVLSNGPLLDTFDGNTTDDVADTQSHEPRHVSANDVKVWQNEVPSEEEQMRIISEMEGDGGWNTVAKGGKSKKKSAATVKENERRMSTTSASLAGTDEHSMSTFEDIAPQPAPSQSQTENGTPKKGKARKEDIDPKVWNRSNIHLHPQYDPAYPYALTGHPEDSDWAVV